MPTTRKKIIKTVYDDEDEGSDEFKDFSDSGSEAVISDESISSEEIDEKASSADEFQNQSKKPVKNKKYTKKPQFTKSFLNRINKQMISGTDEENPAIPLISVKDLTDEDKLLPPILNLSESDSSDNDEPNTSYCHTPSTSKPTLLQDSESEKETVAEYMNVWPKNLQDDSAEIAKKTFEQLEQHSHEIENTKAKLAEYKIQNRNNESSVRDLLALGEELAPSPGNKRKLKLRKKKIDSESEIEDWEEVKEVKTIPQQGIQLIVDFPDAAVKRSKKIDVEMMMKRKINRVKKEYQVYMHKVHVLCWLGHGNYVSRVLNDQEILAAALTLVTKETYYPGERVDLKYIEEITAWFKKRLVLEQDKYENKFKPKAQPLKEQLKKQIQNKVVTTKKYLVLIFVSMLRALGLQCRVMLNFTTLPLKPPSSELCSVSTKPQKDKAKETEKKVDMSKSKKSRNCQKKVEENNENAKFTPISQLDGNDDTLLEKKSLQKNNKLTCTPTPDMLDENGPSPPKRTRKSCKESSVTEMTGINKNSLSLKNAVNTKKTRQSLKNNDDSLTKQNKSVNNTAVKNKIAKKVNTPKIQINKEDNTDVSSEYFMNKITDSNTISVSIQKTNDNFLRVTRTRSQINPSSIDMPDRKQNTKQRTKSAPGKCLETSKYFKETESKTSNKKDTNIVTQNTRKRRSAKGVNNCDSEDEQRISHKDLLAKTKKKPKNDVKPVLIKIIKDRVKEAKAEAQTKLVKGKVKQDSDSDSDYLPEEDNIKIEKNYDSDVDFKSTKVNPKKETRKLDRRVLSSDEETPKDKTDVWCEVYVEELEQWISVDVVEAKVHCCNEIYKHATHPVTYIVGWDNNNYLKDLTRRYVPHWNTITRKLRVEPSWWNKALQPWRGPKTAKDKEEDEHLDKLLLEAPLPKSITEYKNHPLYALTRHLLKFEAIYPPDAPTLGFVRSEPVYARECVYVCRSRDVWLKEAKVVRLSEKPYKIVKARPKWDKLSNKVIKDQPLELFGPWQVQDYEPPVAENGIVPRNAYGNVELFKACMLPKRTVHMKLPGLNKVAKKLNIDCAPAMIGFDFNGGWTHPVYDGFVVCEEFEEILRDAWIKDQEEQERREQEKLDARVYGNWKRLIRGLLIRERLKEKYGFEEPTSLKGAKKKSKGPRLVVKK